MSTYSAERVGSFMYRYTLSVELSARSDHLESALIYTAVEAEYEIAVDHRRKPAGDARQILSSLYYNRANHLKLSIYPYLRANSRIKLW